MVVDKFLNSYRALETELRFDEKSVLDYENELVANQDPVAEKLKVCRIMRNYMAHNDTIFLSPSSAQIKFLDRTVDEIRKKSHTVKDEMKRVQLIKPTETIKTIVKKLDRNPIIPMEVTNGIYLIDKDIIVHQLALGNKKVVVPKRLPKNKYTTKDTRIEQLSKDVYVVTDTGKEDGKYLGILNL